MSVVYKNVMMKPNDNVATALMKIPAGAVVRVICQDKGFEIVLKQEIEFGHKFAVVPIQAGEDVLKYGEVIGVASQAILPGEHVHVHNVEGKRGRGDRTHANESSVMGI
ncbi:UxaA family hydrolase [Aneurinibacillus danicus]|jgi:altronate dehydratase small subunit|uniref:D-galactarate dehydratase n=1 Tax=Aneurinibacillus danicus TaxID=267746 RepID=A0A511VFZ2_9BACL|nr:UxaA family hydrolase [Aneurinibacillus danicus]GEN36152.1 D-galactarate dehydratase [Aneurinibacillus danicus]